MNKSHAPRRAAVLVAALAAAGLPMVQIGCQSEPAQVSAGPSTPLRPLHVPAAATPADSERAALARFIGTWTLEGWSTAPDGSRLPVGGRAAGAIESEHFVLLDLQATSGEFQGRAGRKSGSMMFASEPGVGLTLTAWGDASPAMNRLIGEVDPAGSVFTFAEVSTPAGAHRLQVVIAFQTDDRWSAEVHDITAAGDPLIASYTFQRTPG